MLSVTGRERASRIPLDYFKKPGLWERRRRIAAIVAAVAAAAWWTGGTLLGHKNAEFHSPGSLASVHQMWESDCAACHADFRPIRDEAAATPVLGGSSLARQNAEKCQTCHAATEHHFVAKPDSYRQGAQLIEGAEVPSCASCHHDHQGTTASLLRMDDSSCTRCHATIQRYIIGKPASLTTSAGITRFDKDHPEFSSLKKDPGHLKFSHHRHLTPGLVNDLREDKTIWRLKDISDPAQRERYRRPGQGDDAAVQLDCGSCHQLDAGDFGFPRLAGMSLSSLPARAAGSYMLPITYENQCQACHALYEKPGVLQHRQTPDEVRAALRREFAAEYLQDHPELLERTAKNDRAEAMPNTRPPEDETIRRAIDDKLEVAQNKLSQEYCGKCHEQSSSGPGLQPFVPTQVPQVWFEHAKFDHRSHRAMDCRSCHANVADPTVKPPKGIDIVMPSRDTCVQCHSPPSQTGTVTTGGARFDCAECHRYHNGSALLSGGGAKAESPLKKLSVEDFQAGKSEGN